MAVERLKAKPFLGVKLPHIPITKCVGLPFRTFPGPNATEDHSQGAFLVGATSPGLWKNLPSPFALLSHTSHCLKRKCSSTFAAETQIVSEGVEWIRGLFEELTNPNFSIVEWNRGLSIAARSSDAEVRFSKVLSIGDAQSLYDHLRTKTSGGANDRRTAIDIQIIKASMDARCVGLGDCTPIRSVPVHTPPVPSGSAILGKNLPRIRCRHRHELLFSFFFF